MDHISGVTENSPQNWREGPRQGCIQMDTTLDLPGIGPLTPIETDFGHIPAQALRVRDRVRLRSGRYCAISWVDKLILDEAFLERNHDAQPVLVMPGRLGYGLPAQPLHLAPGQKLSGRQGYSPSLQTARDLLRGGIAHRQPERFLTYVLFGFVEAEDVCSSGLWLRVEPRPSPQGQDEDGE